MFGWHRSGRPYNPHDTNQTALLQATKIGSLMENSQQLTWVIVAGHHLPSSCHRTSTASPRIACLCLKSLFFITIRSSPCWAEGTPNRTVSLMTGCVALVMYVFLSAGSSSAKSLVILAAVAAACEHHGKKSESSSQPVAFQARQCFRVTPSLSATC